MSRTLSLGSTAGKLYYGQCRFFGHTLYLRHRQCNEKLNFNSACTFDAYKTKFSELQVHWRIVQILQPQHRECDQSLKIENFTQKLKRAVETGLHEVLRCTSWPGQRQCGQLLKI